MASAQIALLGQGQQKQDLWVVLRFRLYRIGRPSPIIPSLPPFLSACQ